MSLTRTLHSTKSQIISRGTLIWTKTYAKSTSTSTTAGGTGIQSLGKTVGKTTKVMKPSGKAVAVLEKKILSVETDPQKLVTHLCGSCFLKEGEDIKLKSDEEYPDWLWELRTGPPLPIEELEPDTEGYWKRVKRLAHARNNSLRHLKKFPRVPS